MDEDDPLLRDAFERLRVMHLAFRRAEPEEMRELEAMRLEVFRMDAELESKEAPQHSARTEPLRLLLMERAFNILRLSLFANAQENQGWMNLFRLWSRSDRFNATYQKLKMTVSPQFRAFYETCIGVPEAAADRPIHHPWHRQKGDSRPGIFMDKGRIDPDAMPSTTRPGTGGVDDSKGHSGVDQTYESSSGTAEGGEASTKPNE